MRWYAQAAGMRGIRRNKPALVVGASLRSLMRSLFEDALDRMSQGRPRRRYQCKINCGSKACPRGSKKQSSASTTPTIHHRINPQISRKRPVFDAW
jgi:hypothetical protein